MSADLTMPRHHRFLSPHYDDIALSCGGTAAFLARSGLAPEVAVVFGQEPDPAEPLTPFAAWQHQRWGLTADDVIARRRREEADAAAILGARSTFLPFRDAIYRGDRYLTDDLLIGEPAPDEAGLPDQIMLALGLDGAPDRSVRIYAPLAIGGHVDHRLAFAAGDRLADRGWDVWFYEDLPYALREGALDDRLGQVAVPLARAAVVDVASAWDAKVAAILAYRSQLGVVFRHLAPSGRHDEIDAVMRSYATRVGNGVVGEQFWQIAL